MNITADMLWHKTKVDEGVSYVVTQMFFDNEKFFNFVARAGENGITVSIAPGVKPLTHNRLTGA